MKQTSRTIRLALPLAVGLSVWAGHARADSPQSLMALSATLQGAAPDGREKSLSEKLAPSPLITSLAGTRKMLASLQAPKRLAIDVRSAPTPNPKNKGMVRFQRLTLGFTSGVSQTDPPKRLGEQLTAAMSWKAPM